MAETAQKIALITGASRGIGYAAAKALGARGHQVIALARTVGGLEDLDTDIRAAGGSAATLVPLDITDDPALERLGAAINDRWGRIDLWIHTAIYAPPLAPVEHVDAKDLDKSLAITTRSTQRLIRVIDPLLRRSTNGCAVLPVDKEIPADGFHGVHAGTKSAQAALFDAWGTAAAKVAPVVALKVSLPPVATALRARFRPGEDASTLMTASAAAERLLAAVPTDL